MGLLIKTDGENVAVTPEDGKYFRLPELKRFVGGWIEAVRLEAGVVMFVNEEGMMLGLEANPAATQYARRHGSLVRFSGDWILGAAVVVRPDEMETDE